MATMKKIAWLVEKWSVVALVAEAAVKIPIGLALLALAAWIVWNWGNSLIADFVAACIAYHGGNLAIGALAGFVRQAPHDGPSKQARQRRPGISGRR